MQCLNLGPRSFSSVSKLVSFTKQREQFRESIIGFTPTCPPVRLSIFQPFCSGPGYRVPGLAISTQEQTWQNSTNTPDSYSIGSCVVFFCVLSTQCKLVPNSRTPTPNHPATPAVVQFHAHVDLHPLSLSHSHNIRHFARP